MREFFQAFLMMSLQGAVLIAVLLVLRSVFCKRMAPGVLYALWLIPAVRLLIPGSVASVFSFLNLFSEEAEQQVLAAAAMQTGMVHVPMEIPPVAIGPGMALPLETASYPQISGLIVFNGIAVLLAIWIAGMLAVLLLAAWKNFAFIRRAKKDAVCVEADCPLPVYLSEYISSPCLCGVFRPVILVTDETLESDASFNLALRHELEHYRVGDRFWALLRLFCCAAHWFNPLVWIAAKASVQDCERACDARVLKHADQAEREAYGALLLSCLKGPRARHSLLCAASPMGGSREALRRRVALIAEKPVTKKAAVVLLAVCVGLTCLVACTTRTQAGPLEQLQSRIAPEQQILCDGEQSTLAGRTLINVLSDKEWMELAAEDLAEDETRSVLYSFAGTCVDGADASWLLSVERCTVQVPLADLGLAQGDLCYVGRIVLPGGKETCYVMPEEDAHWLWAVQRLGADEKVFHSALPEGGEVAMVCSAPAMGMERHYFFSSGSGAAYTPIDSDLDEQYARVAENMLFVSRDVGFVTFRYENAETAPDLFRTADGGKTWQRVTLPMGDITTENGYGGMHITGLQFGDISSNGVLFTGILEEGIRCGIAEVSFTHNGTPLSSLFSTADGGESWMPVTSSLPMQHTDAGTVERTADPQDPKSAYLVQERISLSRFETMQLTVRGVTTKIRWSSADPAIASVDENGLVRGEGQGETVVTASWDGQRFDCRVFCK